MAAFSEIDQMRYQAAHSEVLGRLAGQAKLARTDNDSLQEAICGTDLVGSDWTADTVQANKKKLALQAESDISCNPEKQYHHHDATHHRQSDQEDVKDHQENHLTAEKSFGETPMTRSMQSLQSEVNFQAPRAKQHLSREMGFDSARNRGHDRGRARGYRRSDRWQSWGSQNWEHQSRASQSRASQSWENQSRANHSWGNRSQTSQSWANRSWETQNWMNRGRGSRSFGNYTTSDRFSNNSRMTPLRPLKESGAPIATYRESLATKSFPSFTQRNQIFEPAPKPAIKQVPVLVDDSNRFAASPNVFVSRVQPATHQLTTTESMRPPGRGRILTTQDVKEMHRAEGTMPNVPDHMLEDWLKARRAEREARKETQDQTEIHIRETQAGQDLDVSSDSINTAQKSSQAWSPSEDHFSTRNEIRVESRIGMAIQPAVLYSAILANNIADAASSESPPDISDFIIKNRDEYEVPELGSEEMPALQLNALPQYKTIWEQANELFPPEIRDIPAPVYAFSKKKDIKIDPATIGALPNPQPQNLDPLPNPLDAEEEQTDERQVEKMGCASSESDFGASDEKFIIVGETIEAASRWQWFVRPNLPLVGDIDGRCLDFQLSRYDKGIDFEKGGCRAGALWASHESIRANIDRWVNRVTANHLRCPIAEDVNDMEFKSGRLPVSGVRYNYQEFPPDLGYRPVRLLYGVIDWNKIPQPKLHQPEFESTSRRMQCSHMIIRLESQRLEKRLVELKIRQEEKQAELRHSKKSLTPRSEFDTAEAYHQSNPWKPNYQIRVRVAKNSDVDGIWQIYMHYVSRTIHHPERIRIDREVMKSRIQAVRNEKYPFLVAILRIEADQNGSMPWMVRNRSHRRLPDQSTEYVVGFANARSWDGLDRCTDDLCQLEVFVAPDFTRAKIGANLLDRLIGCLDIDYQSRRGVAIEVEPTRARWNLDWRNTRTHIIKIYYRTTTEPDFIGRKRFLEKEFGFYEFGNLTNVCTKNGGKKRYSVCFLQRAANRSLDQRFLPFSP